MATEIRVPTLGESVTEATVATWFKKPGDSVADDEMLCELETDKVSVEVPAPAAGALTEILAAEGATVEAGGKLAEGTFLGEQLEACVVESRFTSTTDLKVPLVDSKPERRQIKPTFFRKILDRNRQLDRN